MVRINLLSKPRFGYFCVLWEVVGERVTSAVDVIVNSILHTCYSGFPRELPQLKFRLIFYFFFFSFSHSLQVLNMHARRFDTDEHMAWCNGGRRKVYSVEDQHKYRAKRIPNIHTAFLVDQPGEVKKMFFRALKFRFLADFSFVFLVFWSKQLVPGSIVSCALFHNHSKNIWQESRIIIAGTFSFPLWSSSSIQLWAKPAFHGKKKPLSFDIWLGESEWVFTLEFTCQIFIQ